MTALNKEHTIDFFVSPMALFVIEFTEIEEITGDSVKETLRNRMRPQMAVLLRAGRRRDSTLGTSGSYFHAMSVEPRSKQPMLNHRPQSTAMCVGGLPFVPPV